ncbi:MAG: thioredoxin fold domain-containing protein [Flavobacteriaceae bacterium]|nr:thioredoxin fold domain-containing protein [Flavobacteriaceae bacterium]
MKKIVFLMVLLIGLTAFKSETNKPVESKINWVTMNEALKAQEKNPKKILIDFYTDWCGWCKRLDKDVYEKADMIKYINKNFYAVKFDAEGTEKVTYKGREFTNPGYREGARRNSTHQLAQYFRVSGYPNTVFLDDDGAVLNQVPGYHKAPDFKMILEYFRSNSYKTTSFADFKKNYK